MARSLNRISLIGNVGRDPDVRTTKSGTKVVNLSLATNRWRGQDEEDRADWHRLTFWDKLADFVKEYVKTGDKLYVEGTLQYDSYERDGVTIPTAEIHVREVILLSSREVRDTGVQ